MKICENRWKVYKKIYKKINKGKFIKRIIKGGENKGGAAAPLLLLKPCINLFINFLLDFHRFS